MCGFYNNQEKIKPNDTATYNGKVVTIASAKHIKENKTMDIVFIDEHNNKHTANIPYKTVGYGFELIQRG